MQACGPVGGPSAGDKEAELKAQATTMLIPEWQLRLSNALMQPVTLEIDIKGIVDALPDPKLRLKTLRMIVVGAQGAMEQGMAFAKSESTIAIVESIVQSVELVCVDPTVRTDVAAQIKRVALVACAPEVPWPPPCLPLPNSTHR